VPDDSSSDQKAYYEAARALNERTFKAKERRRKELAALGFTEKIKIMEKLRDRERAIAAAGLRKESSGRENWSEIDTAGVGTNRS
jgi:hypothetical protein